MDGSLFSPVVELRNTFESLPGFLRTPIEMVVFGGELPRADISEMRRMVAEFRARARELENHSTDIEDLLAQEDSAGELADKLREALRSYRKGAARLGDDVNTLADQAQQAANDAEKWLCVMFAFGIHLAWKIYGLMAGAAAAGPAGQIAAAPAVETVLAEGRAEAAVMRTSMERAIATGGAEAAARLSSMGPLQFVTMLGKAAALPVGVDAGVQALQVATGDRTADIIGSDGTNPTGIDLKSIEVAALAGAGGAVGGMVAGKFAPMVFPRIGSSRLALGLVHGTAGAISGLGAASLVAGWPQHYDQVLAPLLNGAFAGGVYSRSGAHPSAIDGGATFTPPDAISAGHDGKAATPRRPVEVSAESKRAWADAQKAWGSTAETTKTAGERGGTTEKTGAAEPPSREQGPTIAADGAGGRQPGQPIRPASSDAAAARSGTHSETAAPVERPPAEKPVAAGKATAPRSVEAVGETSPPPKLPTSAPPRPVGEFHEKAGAPTGNSADAKAEPSPAGEHTAVADGAGTQTSARPHPAAAGEAGTPGARGEPGSPSARGEPGSSSARGEPGSSSGEEHATPQREETAEQSGQERPEGSGRTEADGTETPAVEEHSSSVHDEQSVPSADHDSLADAAGMPRSDRDKAVDLLIDFHQASAEHVPEGQRLSNLPDDVLMAGLHSGDEHQSLLATMEIIRRGTISEKVPGGMVLRVEQAEAVYAMKSRPVEMKPGEGKSLVFMAGAIQRAVQHGSVLLVTTTDGLANREVSTYRKLLTGDEEFADIPNVLGTFGIDVFRADQQNGFGPITKGRPAIVVATGETVGHLCNAGIKPPRHALIDEMDGIIDRGERQFLRSEGAEQAAPEVTAQQVFGAHDFLTKALADGSLTHDDFGLRRIAEEIGMQADGTPEVMYWYDGQPELTPEGRAKVEALPGGQDWLDGMGASRLETAAHAEFLVRKGVHYEMDTGKIVIIDQAEHGLQRNPKTSSESRWSAEPGKASLAQAIEAKEIRAAESRRESAEEHRIVVRADAESAKRIDSVEIYRVGSESFFDEVTGASGTLTDLNPVLQKIYNLEPAHEVGRSQTHQLVEGQHDVVESTHAKLRTIAEYANEMRADGKGRFQEILCHRNDLVARQVEALVRAGVPRDAIEAVDAKRIIGWGADWEAQLQKVFDEAGEQGKILVINRQGQRGVDISVSEAVKAKGGMHVWMTEAPEQSYIHEQAKNRTARNGQRGSAQVVMSAQDALIRNAMHLRGVRETVVVYEKAVAAHATDPTPQNHDALVAARQAVRELVPELQQRALRHSTAEFVRHHAVSTGNAYLALAEADTGLYDQPDSDPAARLAGLLGIPAAAVADRIAELERDGATDPIRELLDRAGIAPATAVALQHHVMSTAPAAASTREGQSAADALIQPGTLRRDLAAEFGIPIADLEGAEGLRTLDPLHTQARDALAAALGYPAAGITPIIARDILGEAVGDQLTGAISSTTVTDTGTGSTTDSPTDRTRAGTPDQDADTQNADAPDTGPNQTAAPPHTPDAATTDDIVAAASRYLAVAALFDAVFEIHRLSPNNCVNNAVTGMRVLCPDKANRFRMPDFKLRGHDSNTVRDTFGAELQRAGSLDEVAESLRSRPGGITVLVYKWKDTYAAGTSIEADDHMVLLVNDSTSVDKPNLVVVDLAASRDGNTDNDHGPKDLRNRRTLLNKAEGFDDWRREQEKYIKKLGPKQRLFRTIEFDRDGNLAPRLSAAAPDAEKLPQRPPVSQATQDEINSSADPGLYAEMLARLDAAGNGSNARRRDERSPVGSRPSEDPANPPPPSTRRQYTVTESGRLRDDLATAYRELEDADDSDPLAESFSRAIPSQFDEHFRALSPIQRRILTLRYQQGLAHNEVADTLNARGWAASALTPQAVRTAEAGALRRLAGSLARNGTPMASDPSRERQQTLLRLIARGVSWSGVIEQTGWSRATGRRTYSQVLQALNVTKRASVVPEAVRHGLLDITELSAVPEQTPALSPDEHTMLFLVATGLSNRAVADALTAIRGVPVGKDAVNKRLRALGQRIRIGDRAGMVGAAIRAGWLDVNADDWKSHSGTRGTAVRLSTQELRTLGLIISGRTDDQIAAELNTTRQTAVTYRNRIFVKLGVHSREEAIVATYTMPELVDALPDSGEDIRAIVDILRMVEEATDGREAGQPEWRRLLVHQLRHAILSGDVVAGRALPSARLLMRQLNPEKIQAYTVRDAYRQLRDEGYLVVVRGRPTVTRRDSWPITADTLRNHFADRIFDLATRTVGAASGSQIVAEVCARAARGAETGGRTVTERVDLVARNVIAEHRPAAEFLRHLTDFVLRGAGMSGDDTLALTLANVSTHEVRQLRAALSLNRQLRLARFWPARRDSTAPHDIPTDPMTEPLELWSTARDLAILLAERHGVTVSLPVAPTGHQPWRILDNWSGKPSARPTRDFRLTPYQRRLVRLLAQDLTYREIAAELGVSVDSLKSLVADVTRELHGEGRAEIVEIARRSGLLDDISPAGHSAHPRPGRAPSPVTEQPDASRRARLTNRESHILALSEQGLSKREIAEQLGVSPHTVEDHLGSARRKIRKITALLRACVPYVSRLTRAVGLEEAPELPLNADDPHSLERGIHAELTLVPAHDIVTEPAADEFGPADPLRSIADNVYDPDHPADGAVVVVGKEGTDHAYLLLDIEGELFVFDSLLPSPGIRPYRDWKPGYIESDPKETFVSYLTTTRGRLEALHAPSGDPDRPLPGNSINGPRGEAARPEYAVATPVSPDAYQPRLAENTRVRKLIIRNGLFCDGDGTPHNSDDYEFFLIGVEPDDFRVAGADDFPELDDDDDSYDFVHPHEILFSTYADPADAPIGAGLWGRMVNGVPQEALLTSRAFPDTLEERMKFVMQTLHWLAEHGVDLTAMNLSGTFHGSIFRLPAPMHSAMELMTEPYAHPESVFACATTRFWVYPTVVESAPAQLSIALPVTSMNGGRVEFTMTLTRHGDTITAAFIEPTSSPAATEVAAAWAQLRSELIDPWLAESHVVVAENDSGSGAITAYFGPDADEHTLVQEVDTTDVVGDSRVHTERDTPIGRRPEDRSESSTPVPGDPGGPARRAAYVTVEMEDQSSYHPEEGRRIRYHDLHFDAEGVLCDEDGNPYNSGGWEQFFFVGNTIRSTPAKHWLLWSSFPDPRQVPFAFGAWQVVDGRRIEVELGSGLIANAGSRSALSARFAAQAMFELSHRVPAENLTVRNGTAGYLWIPETRVPTVEQLIERRGLGVFDGDPAVDTLFSGASTDHWVDITDWHATDTGLVVELAVGSLRGNATPGQISLHLLHGRDATIAYYVREDSSDNQFVGSAIESFHRDRIAPWLARSGVDFAGFNPPENIIADIDAGEEAPPPSRAEYTPMSLPGYVPGLGAVDLDLVRLHIDRRGRPVRADGAAIDTLGSQGFLLTTSGEFITAAGWQADVLEAYLAQGGSLGDIAGMGNWRIHGAITAIDLSPVMSPSRALDYRGQAQVLDALHTAGADLSRCAPAAGNRTESLWNDSGTPPAAAAVLQALGTNSAPLLSGYFVTRAPWGRRRSVAVQVTGITRSVDGVAVTAELLVPRCEPATFTVEFITADSGVTARWESVRLGSDRVRTAAALAAVHSRLRAWLAESGGAWVEDVPTEDRPGARPPAPEPIAATPGNTIALRTTARTSESATDLAQAGEWLLSQIRDWPPGAATVARDSILSALRLMLGALVGPVSMVAENTADRVRVDVVAVDDEKSITPPESVAAPDGSTFLRAGVRILDEPAGPWRQVTWFDLTRPASDFEDNDAHSSTHHPPDSHNATGDLPSQVLDCVPWITRMLLMLGLDTAVVDPNGAINAMGLERGIAAGLLWADPDNTLDDPMRSAYDDLVADPQLDTVVVVVGTVEEDGSRNRAHAYLLNKIEGKVFVYDTLIDGGRHRIRPYTEWRSRYRRADFAYTAKYRRVGGVLTPLSRPADSEVVIRHASHEITGSPDDSEKPATPSSTPPQGDGFASWTRRSWPGRARTTPSGESWIGKLSGNRFAPEIVTAVNPDDPHEPNARTGPDRKSDPPAPPEADRAAATTSTANSVRRDAGEAPGQVDEEGKHVSESRSEEPSSHVPTLPPRALVVGSAARLYAVAATEPPEDAGYGAVLDTTTDSAWIEAHDGSTRISRATTDFHDLPNDMLSEYVRLAESAVPIVLAAVNSGTDVSTDDFVDDLSSRIHNGRLQRHWRIATAEQRLPFDDPGYPEKLREQHRRLARAARDAVVATGAIDRTAADPFESCATGAAVAAELWRRRAVRMFGFDLPGITVEVTRELARAIDQLLTKYPYVQLLRIGFGPIPGTRPLAVSDHVDGTDTSYPYTRSITVSEAVATDRELFASGWAALIDSGRAVGAVEEPVLGLVRREFGYALNVATRLSAQREAKLTLVDHHESSHQGPTRWSPREAFAWSNSQFRDYGPNGKGRLDAAAALAGAFAAMEHDPRDTSVGEQVLHDLLTEVAPQRQALKDRDRAQLTTEYRPVTPAEQRAKSAMAATLRADHGIDIIGLDNPGITAATAGELIAGIRHMIARFPILADLSEIKIIPEDAGVFGQFSFDGIEFNELWMTAPVRMHAEAIRQVAAGRLRVDLARVYFCLAIHELAHALRRLLPVDAPSAHEVVSRHFEESYGSDDVRALRAWWAEQFSSYGIREEDGALVPDEAEAESVVAAEVDVLTPTEGEVIVHRNISELAAAEAERRGMTSTEPTIGARPSSDTTESAGRTAHTPWNSRWSGTPRAEPAQATAGPGSAGPVDDEAIAAARKGTDEERAAANPARPTEISDEPAHSAENSRVYHHLMAQLGDPRLARDLAAKAHARAEREQQPTDPEAATQHLLRIADTILAEHRTAMAQLDDAMDNKPTPRRRQRLTSLQHGGVFFHNRPDIPEAYALDRSRATEAAEEAEPQVNPHARTPWSEPVAITVDKDRDALDAPHDQPRNTEQSPDLPSVRSPDEIGSRPTDPIGSRPTLYVPEPHRLAAELLGLDPSFAYIDDLMRIAAGEPHGPAWIDSPDYWEWQLNWLAERGPRLSTLAAFSAAALEAETVLGLPNTSGRGLLLAQLRPRTPGEMMAIYKLETMRADEPDRPSGPDTAAHASAIGRVERELSLDELPQYAYLPTVAARPVLQADRDLTRKYQSPAEFWYFDPIPRDGVFGANYPGCRALDRQSPAYHRARHAGDSLLPLIACRPVYDRFLNHWIEPYQLRHAEQLRDGFQGTRSSPENRIAQWFTSVVADVLAAPPDAAPEILHRALHSQLRRRTGRSVPTDDAHWRFVSAVHELLSGDYDFGHYLQSRDHPETEGYARTVRETVLRRHSPTAVARVPFIANVIGASPADANPSPPEGGPTPATPIGARPNPADRVRPRIDDYLARGDTRGAVALLREQFAHKVFPWVRHHTPSAEAAQEIFEAACRRAISDIGRIGDRDIEQWLVLNAGELISQHHSPIRTATTEPAGSAAAEHGVPTAELTAALRRSRTVQHLPPIVRNALDQDREGLQAAIEELAPGPRRLLDLRFGLGMSVQRTAEAMGRTEGAVRTAQRGAFLRLARLLEQRAGNQPFEVVLEALEQDLDAFTRCLAQLGPEQRAAVEGRLLRKLPTRELVEAYGPNHYATYYRAVQRLSALLLGDAQVRPGVDADRELVQRTSTQTLEPAIAQLTNAAYRQALTLRFVHGLPRGRAAAAAQTGLPAFEMREIRAIRTVATHLRAGTPARQLPDFHLIPDPDSDLFGDRGSSVQPSWLRTRRQVAALPVVNVDGGGHGRGRGEEAEESPEPEKSSLWRLLRNRPDIALRSSGQVGSALGSLLTESMMPYYLLSTAGPEAASWVGLVGTLPYLGGPIFAGILAEHKPARPIMVAGETLALTAAAAQATAIATGAPAMPLTMSLATAAMSAGAILYDQTSAKVFREMFGVENAEELARYNNMQAYLPRIITGFGPAVATTAPLLAPVVNGLSSIWNLGTMRGMPKTATTPMPTGKNLGTQVMKSAGEGFRALRKRPMLQRIATNHGLTNFALGMEWTYYSMGILDAPMPEWQKFSILTAIPLGTLLGGRIPTKLREKLDIDTILTAKIAGLAGVGLAEALSDDVMTVAPFWVAAWATLGAGNVSVGKYKLQNTPGEVYARANSVQAMVGRLASPLGGLAVGAGLLNLGMGPAQWISAGALTALASGFVVRNIAERRAPEPVAAPDPEVIRNCAIQVARIHRALGYDLGSEPDDTDRRWNAGDNWRITEESLGNQLRPFDTGGKSPVHEAAEIIRNPDNDIDSAAVVIDGHIHYVVAVEGETGTEILVFDTLVEDPDEMHVRNISGDENGENAWTASYDEFGNAFAAFWTSTDGRPVPVGTGRGRLLQPMWTSRGGNLVPAFHPIRTLRHRTHPVKLLGRPDDAERTLQQTSAPAAEKSEPIATTPWRRDRPAAAPASSGNPLSPQEALDLPRKKNRRRAPDPNAYHHRPDDGMPWDPVVPQPDPLLMPPAQRRGRGARPPSLDGVLDGRSEIEFVDPGVDRGNRRGRRGDVPSVWHRFGSDDSTPDPTELSPALGRALRAAEADAEDVVTYALQPAQALGLDETKLRQRDPEAIARTVRALRIRQRRRFESVLRRLVADDALTELLDHQDAISELDERVRSLPRHLEAAKTYLDEVRTALAIMAVPELFAAAGVSPFIDDDGQIVEAIGYTSDGRVIVASPLRDQRALLDLQVPGFRRQAPKNGVSIEYWHVRIDDQGRLVVETISGAHPDPERTAYYYRDRDYVWWRKDLADERTFAEKYAEALVSGEIAREHLKGDTGDATMSAGVCIVHYRNGFRHIEKKVRDIDQRDAEKLAAITLADAGSRAAEVLGADEILPGGSELVLLIEYVPGFDASDIFGDFEDAWRDFFHTPTGQRLGRGDTLVRPWDRHERGSKNWRLQLGFIVRPIDNGNAYQDALPPGGFSLHYATVVNEKIEWRKHYTPRAELEAVRERTLTSKAAYDRRNRAEWYQDVIDNLARIEASAWYNTPADNAEAVLTLTNLRDVLAERLNLPGARNLPHPYDELTPSDWRTVIASKYESLRRFREMGFPADRTARDLDTLDKLTKLLLHAQMRQVTPDALDDSWVIDPDSDTAGQTLTEVYLDGLAVRLADVEAAAQSVGHDAESHIAWVEEFGPESGSQA
ncbi:LuxR C-terminal-related transcriptional regulator [Nocardia nova]|uniref:LuxR C-terminal-related transcriptional regulator n=1 Tax=Nocardia nova TaxID=37330 RepID=UPI000B0D25FD|nr:LuxR C-terminal-related transcriptional regulator [Nocardia nova]